MPRLRRRTAARFSFDRESFLVSGEFFDVTLADTFGTLEAARAAWQRHGARLSEEFRRPYFRLWGWWAFEAPPWKHLQQDEPYAPVRDLEGREIPRVPEDPNAFQFLDYVPLDEAGILDQLGLLEADEQLTLNRWRALRRGVEDERIVSIEALAASRSHTPEKEDP